MSQNQEREAKENAKRKAKELQKQWVDGGKMPASHLGGFGSSSSGRGDTPMLDSVLPEPVKPAYSAST